MSPGLIGSGMRVVSYRAASGWRAGVLKSVVGPGGTADVVDCAAAVASSRLPGRV